VAAPGDRDLDPADVPCRLAAQIEELLRSLNTDGVGPFLAEWPRECRRRVPAASCTLPVLAWLKEFAADDRAVGRPLIAELCAAASGLAWRQTYSATQIGADFLRNYGWTEILGSAGPLVSERLACGFLALGPATRYPSHRHPAQEIYVPLSGTALWQQGQRPWRELQPGSVIYHASEEPHAMHTGTAPLLALYLWRGDTAAKSRMLD
jgi:mannose-6-phosphate isomerase-like protein (cupin superfamily)